MELLARLTRQGKQVSVMVDSVEHLNILNETGKTHDLMLYACLEIDMAYRPLGLRRSPVRTVDQALALVRFAKRLSHVRIDSIMGHEGHIAGTNDNVPHKALDNAFKRALKNASVRELTSRRQAVIGAVRSQGVGLRLVNGGGSLVSTVQDESVTEATIGSGRYAAGLFHHFREVDYQPSAFFALQVVRKPKDGMVTCAGGGYIASGAIEKSRLPLPVMPVGIKLWDWKARANCANGSMN
jgi:D-serine deaminase-like pyridoxal phosphate-dependent protein